MAKAIAWTEKGGGGGKCVWIQNIIWLGSGVYFPVGQPLDEAADLPIAMETLKEAMTVYGLQVNTVSKMPFLFPLPGKGDPVKSNYHGVFLVTVFQGLLFIVQKSPRLNYLH